MPTVDFSLICLEELPSTNSYLKELNRERTLKEGTVVRAVAQRAGRGQAGNHWEAEAGKNLTFSLLLYPPSLPVRRQFLLSQCLSLALIDFLREELEDVSIKWPNDIYCADKKICGVLIENEIEGNNIMSSVMGIGLNVNQTRFVSDAPNPVSMKQLTGKDYDPDHLLRKLLLHIAGSYRIMQTSPDAIHARYHQHLYHGEGFFPFWDKQGKFIARIVEVKPEGYLVLETEKAEVREYLFKEVSFSKPLT